MPDPFKVSDAEDIEDDDGFDPFTEHDEDEEDEHDHTQREHIEKQEDLEFAKPPKLPDSPPHAELAELITETIRPLESAIETLVEAQDEESQARAQANKLILNALSDIKESMQQVIDAPQSGTDSDNYNISALQFQAAMLQPCNGQILPAAVWAEIDRLYAIEKAYKISKCAERALDQILNHDQILLKLPDDPDEQLLFMSVLNGWYTQAYPDRKPLKSSRPASPPNKAQ